MSRMFLQKNIISFCVCVYVCGHMYGCVFVCVCVYRHVKKQPFDMNYLSCQLLRSILESLMPKNAIFVVSSLIVALI